MGRIGRIIISAIILSLSANLCLADSSEPLIFPIPQQMELTGNNFPLTEQTVIVVPVDYSPRDMFFAQLLATELSDRYGLVVRTQRLKKLPTNKTVILIGAISNPLVKQYCSKNGIHITDSSPGAEGYVLNVGKNIVLIAGSDEEGAFYGLQSLRQLIHKKDDAITITGVKVRDWPYKPFRGIRLYIPGRCNISFFKRFLRDFMALYKFNKVILEVNAVMRLERHPELNAGAVEFAKDMIYTRRDRPKGPHNVIQDSAHYDAGDSGILEQREVADLVQYARWHNIEVIPEIPSLTHSYYLLSRHRELAEIQDAEWPDTYCPSNPKSYELLFDVLDEYIEVIKPKMVHIGHDEWRMPVGACEKCKGKNTADLFVEDVTKIYDYLTKVKGVEVAMWGDHLMESVRGKDLNWGSSSIFPGPVFTEEQAKKIDPNAYFYNLPGGVPEEQVIKCIPKDILIFNWFWSQTQKIEGLWGSGEKNDMKLQEMGFKQVYGNFEANIQNWEGRTRQPSVLGGAPSSWSASTEFNFGKDHMVDFLGCANLLWSTHWPERKQLLEIVRNRMPQIHRNLSGKLSPSCDGDTVTALEISQHFNISGSDDLMGRQLGSLKTGNITVGKKLFNLTEPNATNGRCAVAVGVESAKKNPLPKELCGIKLGRDVTSLIFLHACARPAENHLSYSILYNFPDTADLLGWYEIVYEDGFIEIIPIRYGVNILEWDSSGENYCYASVPVCCKAQSGTKPVTFYAFEWTNARLGKKIEQINLKGSTSFKAPKTGQQIENNAVVLLAISTVEKRQVGKRP